MYELPVPPQNTMCLVCIVDIIVLVDGCDNQFGKLSVEPLNRRTPLPAYAELSDLAAGLARSDMREAEVEAKKVWNRWKPYAVTLHAHVFSTKSNGVSMLASVAFAELPKQPIPTDYVHLLWHVATLGKLKLGPNHSLMVGHHKAFSPTVTRARHEQHDAAADDDGDDDDADDAAAGNKYYYKTCRSDRPEIRIIRIQSEQDNMEETVGTFYWGMGVYRQHKYLYSMVMRLTDVNILDALLLELGIKGKFHIDDGSAAELQSEQLTR